MVKRSTLAYIAILTLYSAAAWGLVPPVPRVDYKVLDGLLGSEQQAHKAWEPMAGTKAVSLINVRGRKVLRMPCNFHGTKFERASWDRRFKLDLAMCKGIQFFFYCPDETAVSSFVVYFQSGDGWYRSTFDTGASRGWNLVKIHKQDSSVEGRPAGWANVETMRISAWRGRDVDTEFYIAAAGLIPAAGKIVIVRGDSASQDAKAAKQYTDVVTNFLDRAGLAYVVVSDMDVTAERLQRRKLVILPYNPHTPEALTSAIAKFLNAGGKLIACYHLPSRLEPVVGIRSGDYVRQKYDGYFSSIRPSSRPLQDMPAVASQNSWNIHEARAVKGRSHVAAWWCDAEGRATGQPAIVASENCIYLTHVLLPDDAANKLHLLLAMAGTLVPDLWRDAAKGCLDRVGQFGPYDDYESARRGIRNLAPRGNARSALESAGELRSRGKSLVSQGKFSEAIETAEKARRSMIEAYCLAQKPQLGEHRAFWCHSAFGVSGMTWDQAIKLLAENGFTAVLPNMLWGGVAYYKSDVLPVAPEVAEQGDQIRLCLAACKKYAVECHVWKVNYNMGWRTDKKFMAKMKAAGRTQVNRDGSANDRWLCPSHPDNQKLEVESMLEIARKYDVDGLHFDYIRYPGREGCFCSGCRRRFERAIGKRVTNWPADVRSDAALHEKWLAFRRRQITSVVAAVARRARQIRPGIKISAAVFRNWPVHRDSIGQDWKRWCDSGYLDFVCPMDYTPSTGHFQRLVEQQLTWAGRVPCYPGIGLSVWSDPTDICKLIEQIGVTRQLDTGGFTIFNYGRQQAREVLPLLGKGMTRVPK